MNEAGIILISRTDLEELIQKSVNRALSDAGLLKQAVNEWMNVNEAASYLGLAVQTIYEKVHQLAIPVYKRGKKLWFHRAELDAWIMAGRQKTQDELLKS